MKNVAFRKLRESVDWSWKQMEFPRKKYNELVQLSSGAHYASGGPALVQPVNFLKLIERLYVQLLAPRVPAAMFSTKNPYLKPAALDLSLAVNQRVQEMHLEQVFRDVVMEALYGMGILKCGLYSPSSEEDAYGESFADIIRIGRYVVDMSAEDWSSIQYEGNDYWMDYEDFRDAEWIPLNLRRLLQPDDYSLVGPTGESMSKSMSVDVNPVLFKDKKWMRDVWLPDERRMVTYAVSDGRLLADKKWVDGDSPDHGPYHKLIYSSVPGGNLLPIPPASLWRDMHELTNALFRKMANQADLQKTIPVFPGGNEEDVENFRNVQDGQGMASNGAKPEEVSVGGVNQVTLAFFLQCKQLMSYFAGNLDVIGGLQAQSDTVGQEKLLSEAANATLADLSSRTVEFVKGLFRSIAYYEFHDPVIQRTLEKPIPGTNMTLSVPWYAARRQGRFSDYDLDIDVFSSQNVTPQGKIQKLGAVLQQYIFPLMPQIQQAGGVLDVEQIIKTIMKYANINELEDILVWTTDAGGSQVQQSQSPQVTERNYNRSSTGPSPQNQDMMLMQSLLGGGQGK